MAMTTIKIRGKTLPITVQSKADTARYLLRQGFTVSEISKAVPMAYSQALTISKETPAEKMAASTKIMHKAGNQLAALQKDKPKVDPSWGELPKTAHAQRQAHKPQKAKLRPGIGKLRTPGLPSDVDVGECANCGHDVAVRRLPTGFALIHINISSEEYLSVIQFCQAMPKVLLS